MRRRRDDRRLRRRECDRADRRGLGFYLLGRYGDLAALVAKELDEDAAVAGTRVWTAIECLRKAGLPMDAPLALAPRSRSGWAVLASGDLLIATFATSLNGRAELTVFAILTEGRS